MKSILSWHHFLVVPEGLQEFTQVRSLAVSFQGQEEAFPINGVVCLPEVQ